MGHMTLRSSGCSPEQTTGARRCPHGTPSKMEAVEEHTSEGPEQEGGLWAASLSMGRAAQP